MLTVCGADLLNTLYIVLTINPLNLITAIIIVVVNNVNTVPFSQTTVSSLYLAFFAPKTVTIDIIAATNPAINVTPIATINTV